MIVTVMAAQFRDTSRRQHKPQVFYIHYRLAPNMNDTAAESVDWWEWVERV